MTIGVIIPRIGSPDTDADRVVDAMEAERSGRNIGVGLEVKINTETIGKALSRILEEV
jgi:hypothetical protein